MKFQTPGLILPLNPKPEVLNPQTPGFVVAFLMPERAIDPQLLTSATSALKAR